MKGRISQLSYSAILCFLFNYHIQSTKVPSQRRIVEATGFIKNARGEVELVVLPKSFERGQQMPNCGEV